MDQARGDQSGGRTLQRGLGEGGRTQWRKLKRGARDEWTLADTFLVGLIITSLVSVWFPVALTWRGLNARPNQWILPAAGLYALAVRAWNLRRLSVQLGAGFVLVGSFTYFTLYPSGGGALREHGAGHLLLLALNVAQLFIVALLAGSPQRRDRAMKTFVITTASFNAVLIGLLVLVRLGFVEGGSMLTAEAAPVFAGGELQGAIVQRFGRGVATGCVSASAVVMAMMMQRRARGRGFGRSTGDWVTVLLCAVGVALGFSRQASVSVVAGWIVAWMPGFRLPRPRRILTSCAVGVATVGAIWGLLEAIPGGESYWRALVGRSVELFDKNAYSESTMGDRRQMWEGMLKDIGKNPVGGRGQDAYLDHFTYEGAGSHNFALETLHAAGVVGLVAYLVLHLGAFAGAFKACGTSPEVQRGARRGRLGAFVALWIASLTNLMATTGIYWAILGVVTADAVERQAKRGAARSPRRLNPNPMSSDRELPASAVGAWAGSPVGASSKCASASEKSPESHNL